MKTSGNKSEISMWKNSAELIKVRVNYEGWKIEEEKKDNKIGSVSQINNQNKSLSTTAFRQNNVVKKSMHEIPLLGGIAKRRSAASGGYVLAYLTWAGSHAKIKKPLKSIRTKLQGRPI